ncbi:Secreted hemolysin-type calcium-binding protein [Lasiodiplodia theobromae]|uniref:AA1-like domain-containing protein n=1 Tax=Lasiodiplodia theobromae TaxID=45133 RepID=A0A5N5DES9_9PEZI|nr:Secreted hemolysin-type calcium-binding protein [Lasiodiplodia theobromae]KAB2576356.1 hypothetical protein DBV05_g5012 [Lasiodiplodia theobromae]KAF4544055.1 Secreted hemolysin-type calcium-binding protein [Lasiodiplodia theobromae]
MHTTSFLTFFGLAVGTLAAPAPQIPADQASDNILPMEVYNLWWTTKNAIHFFVMDRNTNTTATCEAADVQAQQRYDCDTNARFFFNDDNSVLDIEWTWGKDITGSGTVETPLEIWTCVNATAQFEAGCLAGPLDVPFKIVS